MTPLLGSNQSFRFTYALTIVQPAISSLPGHPTPEEEEARRIAEMGKPILGEHSRLEVMIEESCEFKVV